MKVDLECYVLSLSQFFKVAFLTNLKNGSFFVFHLAMLLIEVFRQIWYQTKCDKSNINVWKYEYDRDINKEHIKI